MVAPEQSALGRTVSRQARKQDKFYVVSPFGVALETLPGGTHQISSGLTFLPLPTDVRMSIVDYLDLNKEEALSQRVRTRPAFLIETSANELGRTITTDDERIDVLLQVHRFALETICNLKCPLAVFGSDGASVTRHHIQTTDLWRLSGSGATLNNGDWDKHATFLRFLYENVPNSPLSILAITRLSKAFREGPTPDGIIDIAICLECLITASTEIKFQFAYTILLWRQIIFYREKPILDCSKSSTMYAARLYMAAKKPPKTRRS